MIDGSLTQNTHIGGNVHPCTLDEERASLLRVLEWSVRGKEVHKPIDACTQLKHLDADEPTRSATHPCGASVGGGPFSSGYPCS